MTNLSVNINKIATLRNARGENRPDVEAVALDIESFGAQGITVHPRPDERHIRRTDVFRLRIHMGLKAKRSSASCLLKNGLMANRLLM